MASIAILEAVNTTAVQFHGQPIITAMSAGMAYVALKPIVENLGMSWGTQQQKLMRSMDKFNCIHMNMVALDSKLRDVLCIPLRKLNGWLFSINPEKVRADIRDKLIQYQEECFTALHDYWNKGMAIRKPDTTVDDRTPLRGIVNRIMGKYGMTYQSVYKLVHKEFGVQHIDELTTKQTSEAIEYLAGKVIEGDFIGKESLPSVGIQFSDKELCHLAWLWDVGNRMQDFAADIYPAMRAIESKYAGKLHDYGKEFRWTFEEARKAIEQATQHIAYHSNRDDNWSRVLPRLRKEAK